MKPRLCYTLLVYLLLPWALLHLLLRSRRQPEYRRHWGERFGFGASPGPGPWIWIHAVSVGETRAAQPLVSALRRQYPGHRILLTHTTPTGRQTGIDLLGDTVSRRYLPYDTPGAMARFLDACKPRFGILMETELWPNLVAACHDRGVPLMLANGRLSARSARRYARASQLVAATLRGLVGIAAQTPADAQRFHDLGAADVSVLGNLKFDITPPAAQLELGAGFRRRIGPRPVLLCASTREGEEDLILDAWQQYRDRGQALLVIVPRHPQRFDEVAALVTARGLRLQRRSDDADVDPATTIWLGDSLGEMFAYYVAGDVAFIGGSLLDYGCQNLIEACAVGRPVLVGPSTFNFAEAAANAIAAGAARQVPDARELMGAMHALLADEPARRAMGEAGSRFAATHRGATARTLAWLEERQGRGPDAAA
ncbi:MAG: lipid IV(A) 3-deoxy-D-manno-octulosonic acid transferase [Proteobacteria bacterium]|nr:lipid IV(A) 3-deoxy-D-manno-octulosonic acid transferase [Pseudomonadota bacterium]HQR03860.1 lipid IV(A) 3-deoxy-D-manno-octulosonic acid transferase [Rhodocyclaceae bacterium]